MYLCKSSYFAGIGVRRYSCLIFSCLTYLLKRNRDDKLITTKPEFVNLLLELEHKYRMRGTKKVLEDEIIFKIEVHKFMDQVNDV